MNININQKITYISLLVILFFVVTHEHTKVIFAGVSIFIIGMLFIENGFKLFSGDMLQKVLKNFTNTTPKAIIVGLVSTAITQSSSLVSVIIISFLGAGIMGLAPAIGVIFGANIGTTATAWIVGGFGVKIDIAVHAMPMISLGVILKFTKAASLKGVGNLLIGIGFIFLGISYMKEGFEVLKESIDFSKYALSGFGGIAFYILIGAFATIVAQSSSAAMALVITALYSGQVTYENAIAFSIGANIGTTVTAFLGALTSNENGKRLALAHFIFNAVTALVATVFIYQLIWVVEAVSKLANIEHDYAIKLALFHSIFNVIGVAVMLPFLERLTLFLNTKFISKKDHKYELKFLNDAVVQYPSSALPALKDEFVHFFGITSSLIAKALFLAKNENGEYELQQITNGESGSIGDKYKAKIKSLYGEIIRYATISQENMSEEGKNTVFLIKAACRKLVEIIKESGELEKNIKLYSHNSYALAQYDFYRNSVALTLNQIEKMQKLGSMRAKKELLEKLQKEIDSIDTLANDKITMLIRDYNIDSKTLGSLINDSGYCANINTALIDIAKQIWIEQPIQDRYSDA